MGLAADHPPLTLDAHGVMLRSGVEGASYEGVWVFNRARAQFPGGVFATLDVAEVWIAQHKFTGTLTLYPLDVGVYEWLIARGGNPPPTAAGESAAHQDHHHYEEGHRVA
jgi:hypothetical protein